MPGASFDSQVGATFSGGANATFNNAGAFIKSAGDNYTHLDLLFDNSGSLQVVTGTVLLEQDGNHAGAFVVEAGGLLEFRGSNHSLQLGSSVTGAGTVRFGIYEHSAVISGTYNVTGTTLLTSGSINFNNASSTAFGDLTQSGGTLNVDCAVSISGDFTRSGGTFNAGTGTVSFNGTTIQTLNLTTPTTFHDLTVLAGTTLVEAAAANNASVGGTLTNLGVIRKIRSVSSGAVTFGLTDVAMDIITPGSLSAVQVDRMDTHHPNATGTPGGNGLMTGRYWTISSTGGGYTLTLTLPHANLVDPKVCRYTGSGLIWDCDRTTFSSITVSRQNVIQLSDWAVGNYVGPTAIRLVDFAALPASKRWPAGWLIGLGIAGVSSFVWLYLTRREQSQDSSEEG